MKRIKIKKSVLKDALVTFFLSIINYQEKNYGNKR